MRRRSGQTPASEDARIGARLRDARLARGLDQKALAAQLGLDQSVLSRDERGVFRLPSAVLVQIARTLTISTDEILGLEEGKAGVVVRDRRFLERLPAIDALPERQKDACSPPSTGSSATPRPVSRRRPGRSPHRRPPHRVGRRAPRPRPARRHPAAVA